MNLNPDKNRRILIIDDNPAIHEDFRKVLVAPKSENNSLDAVEAALFADISSPAQRETPQFQIDSAFQGQEGLDMIEKSLAENHPYAMAFVDVRMPPGWDGVETTSKIWQKYPELQVVLCTAYSDYSWEQMLSKLGYSDRLVILKKPFDTVEVMQLAIAMTEKWRLFQKAKFRLDELERMVAERTAELRNTNSDLINANDLLQIATEKTQKMAEGVLVASKAKGEFLANMSHEIRTPMNGVIGIVNLLVETDLTPEQREFAATIKLSADSLLSIINDILDFSKIEAGKLAIEEVDFDLEETVKNAVGLLLPRAHDKGIQLNYSINPAVPLRLVGDPSRLRQILLNLLSNAVKFTEKGQVLLEITHTGGTNQATRLHFSVQDTGMGMSEAVQKTLFQSFAQADAATTRRFGGTGLGLAISRKLVELMDGSIGVSSIVGKGSTFRFDLPFLIQKLIVTPANGPVANLDSSTSVQTMRASSLLIGLSILLAEDNKINQMVAIKQLNRLGYTKVDVVENGVEAMKAWQQGRYNLILMDCQMPEMDGYQTTQKIRELERSENQPHTHIHIIAMTAHAMQGDRELCLAAGMDDYLAKPIGRAELKAAIEKVKPDLRLSHSHVLTR